MHPPMHHSPLPVCLSYIHKFMYSIPFISTCTYTYSTVKSFVEVTRYLLKQPGIRYVLSERFCQDPLESFFGRQRSAGGRNVNPSVEQFVDNTVSLRVQGSAALQQIRGNCRKRPLERNTEVDNTPLPKRRRRHK